jgi:hypothetical protein
MKIGNSPIIGCVHYNPQDYGKHIMDLSMRILDGMAVDPLNYTQLSWISREEVQAVQG